MFRSPSRVGLIATLVLVGWWPVYGWQKPDQAKSPADQLVEVILKKGYKRVAVLPRVVSKKTGADSPVTGKNTVGALSLAWPDELYDSLVESSINSNGKFVVVTDQQVLQALKGQAGEDVGTEEMWKVIREKTGADFVASIDVTDPGPAEGKTGATEIKRVVNGVDLNQNAAAGRVSQMYQKSLSDAAYAGESFVVREWNGSQLKATGLARGQLFDSGPVAEKAQYANLTPQEHPLLREDYPYGLAIEVNGELRVPRIIDGQFVVPLDLGEEYQIRVWNRGERDVFMGLYVDGVNTRESLLEHPDITPTARTWWLKPDPGYSRIRGWQAIDPATKTPTYEKFVIKTADQAVANESTQPGGDGFSANLGMITAIFYTYGMDDVPKTRAIRALPTDGLGTGRGDRMVGGVGGFDPNAKQKGLMLSAITIYYRSPSWFESNPGEQPPTPEVAEGPKPAKDPDAPRKTTTLKPPVPQPVLPKPKPKDSENDLPE